MASKAVTTPELVNFHEVIGAVTIREKRLEET
jgi:hypothetical protein